MSDNFDGSVNPNDEKYESGGGDKTRYCKAGKKVLAPLGFERWKSSKDSAMVSIMFGCVADLEKNGQDAGAVVWRNFALTQNAVQFFARFAKAMKRTGPFNVFKDEDLNEILGLGACVGKVEIESGEREDGKGQWQRGEVKFFDPYDGDWEPQFDDLISEMESAFDEYLVWRAKNPRGVKKSRGGGRSGGAGGSGGSSDAGIGESEIPF